MHTSDDSDVPRMPKQSRRNGCKIFLCGFLSNRLHNEQLFTIARELMSSFFVCTNSSSLRYFDESNARNFLMDCDVLVFWLNRYTLNDYACSKILQMAYELNVHVLMLRHPRLQLVVGGQPDSVGDTSMQEAVFTWYKLSISYEKKNHSPCMQMIINKLMSLVDGKQDDASSLDCSQSSSISIVDEAKKKLRLPPPSYMPNQPLSTITNNLTATTNNRRLSSMSQQMVSRSRSNDSLDCSESCLKPAPTQQNKRNESAYLPRIITLTKSRSVYTDDGESPSGRLSRLKKLGENYFMGSSPDLRGEKSYSEFLQSTMSTNDPALYHYTQYIVYPLSNRAHKPRLIKFPSDVVNTEKDLELESVWGSDTSLEDEAGRASVVKGDLVVCSPAPTPAPYIEPL